MAFSKSPFAGRQPGLLHLIEHRVYGQLTTRTHSISFDLEKAQVLQKTENLLIEHREKSLEFEELQRALIFGSSRVLRHARAMALVEGRSLDALAPVVRVTKLTPANSATGHALVNPARVVRGAFRAYVESNCILHLTNFFRHLDTRFSITNFERALGCIDANRSNHIHVGKL